MKAHNPPSVLEIPLTDTKQARLRFPPPPRLPQLHLEHEGGQAHGHANHLHPLGVLPRAGHVVPVQEAAGVYPRDAVVPVAGMSPFP